MKRWIVFFLLLLIVIIAVIYLLIPSQLTIKNMVMVNANQHAASRHINNQMQWSSWWPGETPLLYEGRQYTINPLAFDATKVIISGNSNSITGLMKLYPLSTDTLSIQWDFKKDASSNPIQRVKDYFFVKQTSHQFNQIITAMKEFMDAPRNLYGFEVQETIVPDTLMVAIKTVIDHYPNTDDVYKLVERLRDYIKRSQADETNQPMLNILKIDSSKYQYMVAIPVNKVLPGEGEIQMKRMIPGNILVTEIRGGEATIDAAFDTFDKLIADYRKTSPAIPFQLLITNRKVVRDTSKWITKLYYPVL